MYSKTFEQCMRWVFKSEGGYVNNSKDPGGCTSKGITIHTLRRWRKRKTTCRDVRKLTTSEAKKIYKKKYWDAVGGDRLPSGANYVIFDMGVNAGPTRGIKLAQRACRVRQDGKMGPATISAINRMGGKKFIKRFAKVRLAYYKKLRGWKHFGRGWRNRVKHSTKRGLWLESKYGNIDIKINSKVNIDKLMSKVDKMFNMDIRASARSFGINLPPRKAKIPDKEPELDVLYGDDSDNSMISRLKGMYNRVTTKK